MAEKSRILNIPSDMHQPPKEELDWNGVSQLAYPEDTKTPYRYYYSKLCQLYFTYELSRYLKSDSRNITVAALNPGFMSETNLAGGKMTQERADFVKINMLDRYGTLSKSSSAAASLITEPQFESDVAYYYDRGTVIAQSSPLSYHLENAKELWQESLKLCKLNEK